MTQEERELARSMIIWSTRLEDQVEVIEPFKENDTQARTG